MLGFLILLPLLSGAGGSFPQATVHGLSHEARPTMVLVCDPGDPPRPVADEIGREEGAAVQDAWANARDDYLVWVVAPDHLSDRLIVEFARACANTSLLSRRPLSPLTQP